MIFKKKLTDAQRQELEDAKVWLEDQRQSIDRDLRVASAEVTDSVFADAIPAGLMERSLEYAVSQGIIEATTRVIWREVFPIDRDMPRGARTKVYTIYSGAGMSDWYRYNGKHPNVSIGAKQVTITFKTRTVSFTLDALEMLAADYAGVSVEALKAARIFQALDNDLEDLFFIGNSAAGYAGLIDHPNITQGDLTTGDWDSYPTTTGQNMVDDVKGIITAMITANKSSQKFRGLKIYAMCSPEIYRLGTTTIANTVTNQTVEQVLQQTDPRFGGFIESPIHGETDGGAGDYITFGAFQDRDSICVPLSMDAERQAPDNRGMSVEQPFATTFAPLHVKEPLHFYQAEAAHS
jgi:hypothetical protein